MPHRYATVFCQAFPSPLLPFVGSPGELLHELKSLVDMLVHLETSIIKMTTQKPQVHTWNCPMCAISDFLCLDCKVWPRFLIILAPPPTIDPGNMASDWVDIHTLNPFCLNFPISNTLTALGITATVTTARAPLFQSIVTAWWGMAVCDNWAAGVLMPMPVFDQEECSIDMT